MSQASNYLQDVRQQYEDLPYPPRDPQDEHKQLRARPADSLDRINHFCFGGKIPLNGTFRALVAGGGTGDSTIYLAEQLQYFGGEVVHVDISDASIAIAKERARIRKLDNITWIHDSLLNIPTLDIGQFQYINCIGVLHHLSDPSEGLKSLESVLADNGVMGIMVYGQIGRIPVYQIQDLMRRVNQKNDPTNIKIVRCKKILESLKPDHWFKISETEGDDHILFGDVGLYDLFLHSQDRAYTVPQLYEWIEGCGLEILLLGGDDNVKRHTYYPDLYIQDPELLAMVKAMPTKEQNAFMELFHGTAHKVHTFYVGRKGVTLPSAEDPEMVPDYSCFFTGKDLHRFMAKTIRENPNDTIKIGTDNHHMAFERTPYTNDLFAQLDGQQSIGEMVKAIQKDYKKQGKPTPDKKVLISDFNKIFESFFLLEWMYLRHQSVPKLYTPMMLHQEAQKRLQAA